MLRSASSPALGAADLCRVVDLLVPDVDTDLTVPPGERCWRRVAATDAYDAWLIGWAPGSGLAWHDHGGSAGALCALRGALVEHSRTLADGPVDVRIVGAGSSAVPVPATTSHAVRNRSRAVAVSLHAYSPPLGLGTEPD